jgi:hypothetical protein
MKVARLHGVGSLLTHRFALEQTAAAFVVAQRREGLNAVVEPYARQSLLCLR